MNNDKLKSYYNIIRDTDIYTAFHISCVAEGVSVREKLTELITEYLSKENVKNA